MLPKSNSSTISSTKKIIYAQTGLVTILALTFTGLAGYNLANNDSDMNGDDDMTVSSLAVPKDATVTAECVTGRGKQYILPKDIPTGPIYDVYQGKVVAVEYLIGQKELAADSSMFNDLSLPKADYNHVALVPTAPHAGLDETHFHTVAYLIPKTAADKITCAGGGDEPAMEMQMTN